MLIKKIEKTGYDKHMYNFVVQMKLVNLYQLEANNEEELVSIKVWLKA